MKRIFIGITLLISMTTACGPLVPAESPVIAEEPTSEPPAPKPTSTQEVSSASPDAAEDAVRAQLSSNLGIEEKGISVVSNDRVEFPDSCMGVAMQNVMCAQVITPGRIIVLESNGVQYEYHTNEDGSRIQPATLALTWKREGGIAGFCDGLTVFLSGEIYGDQCKSQPSGTMGIFAGLLSAAEQKQFSSWINDLGQVDVDASDPENVSDRMVVTLQFFGKGSRQTVSSTNQEALLEFAQSLHQRLYK